MANVYSVEKHPQKEDIIKDILSGKTNVEIAENYGNLSNAGLSRYKNDVLLPELIKEHNQKLIADGLADVIATIQQTAEDTEKIRAGYRDKLWKQGLPDDSNGRNIGQLYLASCKELRDSIKDLASFRTGNIPTSNEITVNVTASPITVSQIARVFDMIEDDELRIKLIEELQKLQK